MMRKMYFGGSFIRILMRGQKGCHTAYIKKRKSLRLHMLYNVPNLSVFSKIVQISMNQNKVWKLREFTFNFLAKDL